MHEPLVLMVFTVMGADMWGVEFQCFSLIYRYLSVAYP